MYFLLLLAFTILVSAETPEEDPYVVLGVPRTASQGEIRKAYKKLALLYHPDKSPKDSDKFSAINDAYEIIGNPDKRAVFDDFGRSKTGKSGFNSYWEFQQSKTKSDNDFYIGDSMITRLTAQLWKERMQGDDIWLVNFYAPWCTHCQQAIPKYKATAGKLDGIVEVAAINCHKEQAFCQNMGIGEYPTFIMFYPKEGFQQRFFMGHGDIEEQLVNFAIPKAAHWKNLALNNALVKLTLQNFDEQVKKADEDFWVILYTGGRIHSKARCDLGRMVFVELSASLKGLAKVGHVDCDTDTDVCLREFPGRQLHFDGFPLFTIYPVGPNKAPVEIFHFNNAHIEVGCGIIEKVVKGLIGNKANDPEQLKRDL